MTDRELLAAYVSTGEPEPFSQLVRRHMGMVYATCLRLLGDHHSAEDAAQATFLVLARKAGRLGGKVILGGWLFRTARHTALTLRQQLARRRKHEQEAAEMRNIESPQREPWQPEVGRALNGALAALPRHQRAVVVLRYLESKSQAEVAREMGCSESTVSATLSRARARRSRCSSRPISAWRA